MTIDNDKWLFFSATSNVISTAKTINQGASASDILTIIFADVGSVQLLQELQTSTTLMFSKYLKERFWYLNQDGCYQKQKLLAEENKI